MRFYHLKPFDWKAGGLEVCYFLGQKLRQRKQKASDLTKALKAVLQKLDGTVYHHIKNNTFSLFIASDCCSSGIS